MKTNISTLAIPKLMAKFSNRESVRKGELWDFYYLRNPDLTEQAFRRILYSLEKEGRIIPIGAGIYGLLNPFLSSNKKKFVPNLSPTAEELSLEVSEYYPYTQYITWETRVLHEFMTHQPGQNQIILEIEKEATESVFNKLKEQQFRNIFLEPDSVIFERYIIDSPESILLLHLVTQSPKIKTKGVVSARLEKILVDIFSDEDLFFTFHGQEMINIFENAFSMYWINLKTLFRYAGRRKVVEKLKYFINTETRIKLSKPLENIE
ncbi:MAG: hypothetical protein CL609_24385 [Anaerolineaceae bacterium]|jgi:hypothetical protein|nr:hypothetical protein [Anaerolineaceae bacterium]